MEKGEKASPSPTAQNLFDATSFLGKKTPTSSTPNIFDAATLLGASPFAAGLSALPFGHLAHLPGAFSMLGHPAFPVTSLFGRLGDGLTHPLVSPSSLSNSLSSSAGSFEPSVTPAIFTLGQTGPATDPLILLTSGQNLVENSKHGLFSSPTFSKSQTSPPSKSSSSKTSSVSPPAKPSHSASAHKSPKSPPGSRQKISGQRGRPRKLTKQPPIPLSLVSGTSILSPSQLEKYMKKNDASATNGYDDGSFRQKSPNSQLSHNGHHVKEKKVSRRGRPVARTSRDGHKTGNAVSLLQDKVHIDSLKKKLIGDQIRQRMQSKTSPPGSRKKRGRGRPPKISRDSSPKEVDDQKQKQEELKEQLEAELKQQQIALRMLKKVNTSPKETANIKSNTSPKETAHIKINTSRTEQHDILNKTTSPRELGSQLFERVKVNAVHEEVDTHFRKASVSPKDSEVTEREISPVKSDGKSSTVKHVGLLNLVRQRSPEGKALQSPSLPQKEELHKPEPLVAKFKKTVDDSSNVSSAGDSDDSSGSSSDSSSSSSDSSDEEGSGSKSESGSISSKRRASECSEGADDAERPIKRRKVVLDETHLQIPLAHGWKRQTHIHTYGRRGIQGEVWYFAPCGRKMKTIPDVMRYLERNSVTDFGRDHFSFSTKVNVGEFYENRSGGENGYVKLSEAEITERLAVTLSRRQKFMENKKKQEQINLQQAMAKRMMQAKMKQKLQHQEMARKVAEMQFKKRLENQQQKELLRRAKQLKILEKRKQKEHEKLLREKERLQREELMRSKRDFRTHQIMEKQRAKAKAKEERQYLKARKQEEQELKRQQAAMLKEQMRLKQEQERQRQHILLLKALEQRKKLEVSRLKAEEKERQKEERNSEKRTYKEKKVEQRRFEFVLAQELKIPREDMELRDFKPMPEYPKIEGCVLDGEAFADCLMTLEFLHNFASALGFDKDTLPTLKGLQDAVTSKTEDDAEEYLSLVSHLLKYALDDPGVPNPKEAVTRLGQKIVDIEVTDAILPEVIRVFMVARNGRQTELSEYLITHPLEACSSSQRASVLAFLCNELNCSKNITTEIERSLDHMGDIRRDKWVVEGKLRRLRVLQAKKFHRPASKSIGDGDSSIADGDDSMTSTTMTSKHNSDEEEGSGNESDGGGGKDESFNDNEEDDPTTLEDLEKQMEKLQKQHAQYRDKVFDASHKVRAIILGQDRYKRTYWVLPCAGGIYVEGMESGEINFDEKGKIIGGDNKTGVKTEPQSDDGSIINNKVYMKNIKTEVKEENQSLNSKVIGAVHNNSEKSLSEENRQGFTDKNEKVNGIPESVECIKVLNDNQRESENSTSDKSKTADSVQNGSNKEEEKDRIIPNGDLVDKQENPPRDTTLGDKNPPQSVSVSGSDGTTKCSSKNVELKIPSIKPCAISSHDNMNLFLQVPSSTKLSDLCNISSSSDSKTVNGNNLIYTSSSPSYISSTHMAGGHVMSPANQVTASLLSPPKPPPAHSNKNTSESKQSFMSIDSILKKEPETSQTNQFFPPGVHALSPLANTLLKDSPMSDGKPWFSILPRVPCDDMSLTRGQHSAGMLTSSPYLSHISTFRSLPVPSPTFSSFQMGQILSHSSSYSSLPGTPSSSGMSTPIPMNDPFKIPDIPNRSCQTPDPEEVLKNLQGEEKPIPEEFQSGWWKISEVEQLRQLQKCLHPRGIREKNLQKTIQKFSEYTTLSCTKGKKEVISLESSDSESEEDEETEENEEENKGESETIDETTTKDTEGTEEVLTPLKETSSSPKETSSPSKPTSPRKDLKDKEKKKGENEEKTTKRKKKRKRMVPVIDCKQKSHDADMMALEEVQTMEDRIASASLQIKGWKLAPKIESDDSTVKIIPRWQTKTAENERYPLEVAKERLLQIESNIERRYLKPPLCKAQKINVNSVSSYDDDNKPECTETVLPVGLQTWRMAVSTATSPAQIMLCIIQLNNSISWEKSIMKVLCQICRKDDNEAQLLLCDGCDRGYHTYCFKPKMESVPEGDWYCFECISKAVGESCCLVCGRRFGKMAECHTCPRAVHLDCLDPPLPRIPRKWFCAACEDEKGVKVKRPRKNSTASTASNSTTSSSPRKSTTPAPVTNSDSSTRSRISAPPIHENNNLTPTGRKKRCDAGIPRKKKNPEAESPEKKEEKPIVKPRVPLQGEESTDMVMCRLIVMEMEKHDDGWPFLQPVNCKQFTSYRKFIKNPMDFSTMKQKLRDESYKTRGDFAADAYLVFDNCKTFNEDDSEVGQCGHTMRKFFSKRWKELLATSTDDDTDEASPS